MAVAEPEPLAGLGVLMTRPGSRGEGLGESIEREGGRVFDYPIIEIHPLTDTAAMDERLAALDGIDLLVFVSVPAVECVVSRLRKLDGTIPDSVRVAAVGHATAKQCRTCGIAVDYVPTRRMDSEGLFRALSGFPLEGAEVLICRGRNGREKLRRELEQGGASVSYLPCYEIRLSQRPIEPVIRQWRQGNINTVLVTSVSIANGLSSLLGPGNLDLFRACTVVTISDRIATRCRELGAGEIVVAESPTDREILAKLRCVSAALGTNDN